MAAEEVAALKAQMAEASGRCRKGQAVRVLCFVCRVYLCFLVPSFLHLTLHISPLSPFYPATLIDHPDANLENANTRAIAAEKKVGTPKRFHFSFITQ